MKLKHVESEPRLGECVYTAPADWKISCLWEAHGNWMAGIYDNNTRRDSKIIWNGQPIKRLVDGVETDLFNAETIGQPVTWNNYVAAAGECGKLIWSKSGHVGESIPLKWASACAVWGNMPVVINWNGKTHDVLDCLTGHVVCEIPGTGIAMSAIEVGTHLVAAIADSDDKKHGLSISDGRLIRAAGCQCVTLFCGKLLYSTMNRVCQFDGTKDLCLGELDCEKIMDMRVIGRNETNPYGTLRIAGGNPDTVWDIDNMGRVTTVARLTDGNAEVGGSCFRVRASDNYVSRCENGTQGKVYRIK